MSKKSTKIDMTAMCDVAFLLLSFFVMTSTAKLPEPLPVDTPASTRETKLPETDLVTITVGDGKVFFGMVGQDVRADALGRIAEKYKLTFTEEETKFFIACTLVGLEYMHSQGVMHRDIKPENLLLDQNGYVRITDMGISRVWSPDNAHDTSGTPGYMAPEVMTR